MFSQFHRFWILSLQGLEHYISIMTIWEKNTDETSTNFISHFVINSDQKLQFKYVYQKDVPRRRVDSFLKKNKQLIIFFVFYANHILINSQIWNLNGIIPFLSAYVMLWIKMNFFAREQLQMLVIGWRN